ncbi:cystathionine beta-synthase [Polaribacter sp. HL-MS24]|uniref:cystathionine beta-synthase n=1 Tax=Polaribacter sp. HL-MS24 TaxID=3077735 RepID=UPI0029346B76|nr:cystathionine beta-synthase [Polaribacter sp. HL-MS24]WOC41126.1 cystathionine beta-synthase [Polaribacter sp. HL-MS24]
MQDNTLLLSIQKIIEHMPLSWINLTTHRLDIYDEKLAKTQFLEEIEVLIRTNTIETSALNKLPTAYDYIRLGHPLSCILEWGIANLHQLNPENIISFSSQTIPILAILRKNLISKTKTQIVYTGSFPTSVDVEVLKRVYGYDFELRKIVKMEDLSEFDGNTLYISQQEDLSKITLSKNIDFYITSNPQLGSLLYIHGKHNNSSISDIQHVRRRETIAMTPTNCLTALKQLVGQSVSTEPKTLSVTNKNAVLNSIKAITKTTITPVVGSSGLSVQYAIMMGLIHHAQENHPGKAIKFIVPPNCYGGTNDQARRVAACIDNVEVVDLPVDGDNEMVQSIDLILSKTAEENAIPYIIAEIPTNPRVEVPDLIELKNVLSTVRKTASGEVAIDPVFILDQTFCPNVLFLGSGEILSTVRSLSYASGSKFPSGGKCTAGYCVGNTKTTDLMEKIDLHLNLCDNEATALQYEILAAQLPSMNQRIQEAYENTREFVNYIEKTLPAAKINFVSQELASQGFTPSVFSLDLPTQGNSDAEKEAYKRVLNLKLINLMIAEIPNESKFCVSYGQLNGCYWTIPATSTQGTTKEGDKDYIVRVALSPSMNLELHKKVFLKFVEGI